MEVGSIKGSPNADIIRDNQIKTVTILHVVYM